jgi:hypothetical protein
MRQGQWVGARGTWTGMKCVWDARAYGTHEKDLLMDGGVLCHDVGCLTSLDMFFAPHAWQFTQDCVLC